MIGGVAIVGDSFSNHPGQDAQQSGHHQAEFVGQAIGEHTFYTKLNLSYGKAVESAKSNALMRCCKDLGIASELWDPKV